MGLLFRYANSLCYKRDNAMKTYIYLASPYTAFKEDANYDEELMQERYDAVVRCYHKLVSAGLTIFCPIAMTRKIDCLNKDLYGDRIPTSFWYEFDKPFIQFASQLFVLKLPGWRDSEGLFKEIDIATARKIPVTYLEFIPFDENCP